MTLKIVTNQSRSLLESRDGHLGKATNMLVFCSGSLPRLWRSILILVPSVSSHRRRTDRITEL